MGIINAGIIGGTSLGAGGGGSNTQLALSDGLACFTQSFSGVSTLSITHGLGTENVVVEFKDSLKNLLVPNNWQVINPNRLDVDFGSPTQGDVTIIGCIPSGISPVTGGVTLLEGLSGIIDLDSPNGSILISVSGQVINLNALFTPASGAVLQQHSADLLTLSGMIDTSSLSKAALNFTPTSGNEFVLAHNLNTLDFTFTMWSTVETPSTVMFPTNVYASGLNHAVVSLDVPTSGRIVFVG